MKFWILSGGVLEEVPSTGVMILDFFSWFFSEVSKQSDQVSQKPDFLLRTTNNDSK